MLRFDNQVAVVTGAGGNPGLGRAYALFLAERGAKVVINDIADRVKGAAGSANADAVVAEITAAGGEAITAIHSIADPEGAQAVIQTAIDAYGRVDILINNAGVCIYAGMEEMTPRDYRLTMDVNIMGTIWMTQAAWPHMVEQGYGRIVNTTSGAARGIRRLSAYGAAKGAVLSFTKALAIEAEDIDTADIRVNAISPAAGTQMSIAALGESKVLDDMMEKTRPEQVAPVVGYLAHESCTPNGEVIWSAAGDAFLQAFYGSERVTGLATIEDVAARIDDIMDLSQAQLLIPSREVADIAKPYTP